MTQPSSTAGYASEAPKMMRRYESASSERVHVDFLDWFPNVHSRVLDIGAGTGRDAAYFVSKGHSVLAVEPVAEMRDGAKRLHLEPEIEWLDDRLPDLAKLMTLGNVFDLIMMSAVWMHLEVAQREAGMANIVQLMASDARLFMTLRHGPVPESRRMFEVTGDETIALATKNGLTSLYQARGPSIGAANIAHGVEWMKLVFEKA